MCGRAAQTTFAANAAANHFGAPAPQTPNPTTEGTSHGGSNSANSNSGQLKKATKEHESQDNYNMSPGMDATVMWMEKGQIRTNRKVWGLVTKGGSKSSPLPSDSKSRMALHFSGLMYNARSDTLLSKPTFSRLARQGKSCVVALDGYFEWKSSPLAGGKGKKQPYFVYRKPEGGSKELKQPFLLVAGLFTEVSTGLPDFPTLHTFTMLTTEACKQIEWLHHRMPLCLWDLEAARQWLQGPNMKTLQAIEIAAKSNNDGFAWHMVTPAMSSMKFRSKDAIEEKKGPKPVSDFFAKADPIVPKETTAEVTTSPRSMKRSLQNRSPQIVSKKARTVHPSPQKGLITSFFKKST